MSEKKRAKWNGSLGFVMAAAGSAVGLGNLYKFPYIVGMNGGGAFVLIYLLCISLIGVPILISELYIGQQGQANTVKSYDNIQKKKNSKWSIAGILALCSAFIILSFYSVVGGWILNFEAHSILNEFSSKSEEHINDLLLALFDNPKRQVALLFVFISLAVGIVIGGVQKGIERWNKILMPSLVLLLLGLLVYSFFLPGFIPACKFLFVPDFSKITDHSILEAIGHSFFTLSVAVGVMITYGSYLSKNENLPKMGFSIAMIDTLLALAAGIVIFSAVFSYDLEVNSGPTLIFQTLPVLFSKMPFGYYIGIIFFLLILFTALTSAISILEVVVSFIEEQFKLKRVITTLFVGLCAFIVGVPSALSHNIFSHIKIFDLNFFNFFDKLTSTIFLPVSGLMTSIFFGWVLGPKAAKKIVKGTSFEFFEKPLIICTRYLGPISIIIILVMGLDWLL